MQHNNRAEQGQAASAVDYGVLGELVGYSLRMAQLQVYEDFARSLERWSITPARFAALVVIDRNPDLKLTDLARALDVARSGAVTLVDALEEPGYVERAASATDRRAHCLRLTARGKRALAAMTMAVQAHDRRVTAALSSGERAKLKRLLDRVAGR